MLDDALVQELAAEPGDHAAVRALRGLRRAHRRALRVRRAVGRALRARRRRAGGDGRLRRGAAQAARLARPRRLGASRSRSARRSRGDPEYPHYTRPAEYRGWRVPDGAAVRPPRGDPQLAPRAQRRTWGAGRRVFATMTASRGSATPSPRLLFAMSTVIDSLERAQLRRVPEFQPGDRVRVHFQVIEGTRRRTQVFEGVVIKRQGHGARETFTVRKQSFGVGVERTFPRALAEDRADRGRRPRRRAPRQALLPARSRRQARPRARAPLHRPRAGRRAGPALRARGGGRSRSTPTGRRPTRSSTPAARPTRQAEEVAETADAGDGTTRRRPADAEAAGDDAAGGGSADAEAAGDDQSVAAATRPRGARAQCGPLVPARRRRRAQGVQSRRQLLELVVIVAVALGLALAHPGLPRQALPDPERVDGADAEDRPARARQPARATTSATREVGDIIVFHPPAGAANNATPCGVQIAAQARRARRRPTRRTRRRTSSSGVVAGPGDTISIRDGHVYRNGKREKDGYISPAQRDGETATSRRRSPFRPAIGS